MDQKDKIKEWLDSERNYEDGVYLYNKYGKNLQLKKLFPNRQTRYADKLTYELGKLVGIGITELAQSAETTETSIVTTKVDTKEENSNKNKRQRKAAERNKKNLHPAGEAYPPILQRVIAEYSGLYNDRGVLKRQQNAIPDENTAENVENRRTIIELIEAISQRLEVLYRAKNTYLETLTVPDENTLWPSAETKAAQEPETVESLTKKRNNLRSGITKISNALEYQSTRKEKKPNPLPPCEKRTEQEKKLKEKEKELEEITKQLEDAIHTEGNSSEAQAE